LFFKGGQGKKETGVGKLLLEKKTWLKRKQRLSKREKKRMTSLKEKSFIRGKKKNRETQRS